MAGEGRTRTRLDPATRREQIVTAAEAVFVGRDPADVTFEQIAAEAGVSRALVYNYFGDKGGLVAAVYLRSIQRLDDALRESLEGRHEPTERLRVIIECYLDFARRHAGIWNLIGTSEATLHPVVQQARRQRYERMAEAWGGSPEARVLARGVIGFLEGASIQWTDGEPCDLDQIVCLLHTVLWSGLRRLPDGLADGLAVTLDAAPGPPIVVS
jgi:AcrR family transcriptional regulator